MMGLYGVDAFLAGAGGWRHLGSSCERFVRSRRVLERIGRVVVIPITRSITAHTLNIGDRLGLDVTTR